VKVWFLKRKNKTKYIQYLQAQRKLFLSISCLQQIKKEQHSLVDNFVGLHELMAIQRNINMQHDKTVQEITETQCKINKIEEKLNNLTHNMNMLQTSMNILLDTMNK
jgi:chromatin segregation and condensation protein Rec8/ScpA/Scc1 (kleisin family)